jgi:hypothetical protein
MEALALCRQFPASTAAEYLQGEDRAQHDRNLAYLAKPASRLASRLSGDAATTEFLSRLQSVHHARWARFPHAWQQ